MNNVVLIIIAIATTFVIDKVFDDVLSPAAKFIVTLLTRTKPQACDFSRE